MELDWADRIDTPCTVCGDSADDWVQVRDGTRRYACATCLQELARTTDHDDVRSLGDTPNAVQCSDCGRLTLDADAGPANRCPDCTTPELQRALQDAVESTDDGP